MGELLTDFENRILKSVLIQHYPAISNPEAHIKNLKVTSREFTTAGGYVNFSNIQSELLPVNESRELGFAGDIITPGLTAGLGALVATKNGKIAYLELFSYGNEQWNGDTFSIQIVQETP